MTRLIYPIILLTLLGCKRSLEGEWRITSYELASGISAWGDEDAKAILNETVTLSDKGLTIKGTVCPGKVLDVSAEQARALTSDLNKKYCSGGVVTEHVYSLNFQCPRTVQFVPYAVQLSNGSYLGFGDGAIFCMTHQ